MSYKLRQFLFNSIAGRAIMLLLACSIYYYLFAYPLLSFAKNTGFLTLFAAQSERLFSNPTIPSMSLNILFALLVVFPVFGRIVYQFKANRLTRRVMAIAMTWGGFCFFLFFPAVFLDISRLFNLDAHQHFQSFSIFMFSSCTLLGIGGVINARMLFVLKMDIQHKKIHENKLIVQLSDVHIGSRSSYFINKIVNKVNSLDPDWVFITGDLVDLSSVGDEELSPLSKINAPVYFVIGNHDRYVSLERLLPKLEKIGIHILRNQSVTVDGFNIVGIDDAEKKSQVKEQLEHISFDESLYSILLYHRPSGFEDAVERKIDLMLSGHTHNGQIFPFNLMVKVAFDHIQGVKKIGDSLAHVSTGTSTWGPALRIGSKNEITLINLHPST